MEACDARLLSARLARLEGKAHYRKEGTGSDLLEEAHSPLPPSPIRCVAWLTRKCGKQASFKEDSEYRYSADPRTPPAGQPWRWAPSTSPWRATAARSWQPASASGATPRRLGRLAAAAEAAVQPVGRVARQRGPQVATRRARRVPELRRTPDLRADLRALRDSAARLEWAAAVEGTERSLAATGGHSGLRMTDEETRLPFNAQDRLQPQEQTYRGGIRRRASAQAVELFEQRQTRWQDEDEDRRTRLR